MAANGSAKGGKKGREQGRAQQQSEEKRLLDQARKQNAELTKKCEELKKAMGQPSEMEQDDGSKEDQARVARLKELGKELKALKSLPEAIRRSTGNDVKISELEHDRAAIEKARREAKPTDKRLEKSQNFEKKLQSDVEKAATRTTQLSTQKEALEQEIAEHEEYTSGIKNKLAEVQAGIADIRASLAVQGGPARAHRPESIETATAESMRSFFGSLAPQVASHPDGQARITNIMQMFEELLSASKQAAHPAEAPKETAENTTASGAQASELPSQQGDRAAGHGRRRQPRQWRCFQDRAGRCRQSSTQSEAIRPGEKAGT